MEAVTAGNVKKGDVLGVARVAGIMGVKKTSELIPMCHPLPIQKCSVDYELDQETSTMTAFPFWSKCVKPFSIFFAALSVIDLQNSV